MAGRSLQASAEGIQIIRKAIKRDDWKQDELKDELGLKTRQPITRLLRGEPIERSTFEELCHLLGLKVEDVAVLEVEAISQTHTIDVLVQEVRDRIRSIIQERCGIMRVLDMTQRIGLDKIYTHVNILEKITGRNRREMAELQREVSPEKPIPGLEAVETHSKLMILGKPGAGKTTFLKHLAMQCVGGKFQGDAVGGCLQHRVPIFMTLKDFAEAAETPDLLTYINRDILQSDSAGYETLQQILQNGRALLLLDGLDEVREADVTGVLRHIKQCFHCYSDNHFVITCRIAAREYTSELEPFTEVEVADFDDIQIADFSGKWFLNKQEVIKAEEFLQKLNANPPIRELATNPLLLTLLCLVFEDSGDFPAQRWKLYRDGFKTLLNRRSQIADTACEPFYKALSLNRREKLFRQIALPTFEQGNYFFDVDVAERLVKQILPTCLSKKNADLEIDDLEIDRFLAAIESQHGILIERAHEVYSFSHLTFHEYFTACEIVETVNVSSLEKLATHTHITETRWREVFLLTTGMLQPADDLLRLMKQQIDGLIAGDEDLQQFLVWVDEKTRSVKAPYKPATIRAVYFSLYLDHSLTIDPDLDPNLDLSDLYLYLKLDLYCSLNPDLYRSLDPDLDPWNNQLRAVMIEHRNIGHDWQFSAAQKERLLQYYNANKLLVDCINSDCDISRSVWEEIEASLLLPIAEIKQRQPL